MQHLVLIDDDAVGLFQDVFERGMGVVRDGAPVLGVDERADVFHRAGAVERYHSGDVAE